jgi:hypothetical protein
MIVEDIAFTLVRKGARAISRRQARTYTHSGGLPLSVDMADSDSEDEVGEWGHTDGGDGNSDVVMGGGTQPTAGG